MTATRTNGAGSIAPTAHAQDAYNERIQCELRGTVWSRTCKNWYLDARGRNIALWPGATYRFYDATRKLVPGEYEFATAETDPDVAPAHRELAEVA